MRKKGDIRGQKASSFGNGCKKVRCWKDRGLEIRWVSTRAPGASSRSPFFVALLVTVLLVKEVSPHRGSGPSTLGPYCFVQDVVVAVRET